MIKFHQKYFIESIPFKNLNPDQLRHSNYKIRNIHNIENKLTRFQIYPETKLHVNTAGHFTKHNIQKFLSNTKTVST